MGTAQGRVKERALDNGILIRQQSEEKKKLIFRQDQICFSFNPEFVLCFLLFLVPTD